jgi:XTP/dITP diphosphohydrolase
MKVVLASANANKLRELRSCLPEWSIEPIAATAPEECGSTYYENAGGKARFGVAAARGAWVLGEDSGLEVAGLGGRPGVHSARYGSPGEDAIAKLLSELECVTGEGRAARYVCELVLLGPDGEELRATGILEGSIAEKPRGSEGFGYDPVLVPAGESLTVAELGEEWKRRHSHRAGAAAALRLALATDPRRCKVAP